MKYVIPNLPIGDYKPVIDSILDDKVAADELLSHIDKEDIALSVILSQYEQISPEFTEFEVKMSGAIVYHLLELYLGEGEELPPISINRWGGIIDLIYEEEEVFQTRVHEVGVVDPNLDKALHIMSFRGEGEIKGYMLMTAYITYLSLQDSLLDYDSRFRPYKGVLSELPEI